MGSLNSKANTTKSAESFIVQDSNIEIKIGTCTMQGWRNYQEDRYSVHLYCHPIPPTHKTSQSFTLVVSLFDGHGGPKTADACKRLWGPYLLSRLHPELQDPALTTPSPLLDEATVRNAFLSFDDKVLRSKSHMVCGATATVLILNSLQNRLVLAHLGDSRALVFTPRRSPIYITTDHSPDHPVEANRVREAGLTINNGRVLYRDVSSLNLCRSFGDKNFKSATHVPQALQAITADPECFTMDYKWADDECNTDNINNNNSNQNKEPCSHCLCQPPLMPSKRKSHQRLTYAGVGKDGYYQQLQQQHQDKQQQLPLINAHPDGNCNIATVIKTVHNEGVVELTISDTKICTCKCHPTTATSITTVAAHDSSDDDSTPTPVLCCNEEAGSTANTPPTLVLEETPAPSNSLNKTRSILVNDPGCIDEMKSLHDNKMNASQEEDKLGDAINTPIETSSTSTTTTSTSSSSSSSSFSSPIISPSDLVILLATDGIWNGQFPHNSFPSSIPNDINAHVQLFLEMRGMSQEYTDMVLKSNNYYKSVLNQYQSVLPTEPTPPAQANNSGIPLNLVEKVHVLTQSFEEASSCADWHAASQKKIYDLVMQRVLGDKHNNSADDKESKDSERPISTVMSYFKADTALPLPMASFIPAVYNVNQENKVKVRRNTNATFTLGEDSIDNVGVKVTSALQSGVCVEPLRTQRQSQPDSTGKSIDDSLLSSCALSQTLAHCLDLLVAKHSKCNKGSMDNMTALAVVISHRKAVDREGVHCASTNTITKNGGKIIDLSPYSNTNDNSDESVDTKSHPKRSLNENNTSLDEEDIGNNKRFRKSDD